MTSPKLFKQTFTFNNGFDAQTTPNIPSGTEPLNLPVATIPVYSTAGFLPSGQISFYTSNGQSWTLQTVSYTGLTATSFTGCTGGTGGLYNSNAYPNSTVISQSSSVPIVTGTWVCPPGVKWVWVTGCGGGGGGGSGASVSATNNSYPLFTWCLAGGGGGGQAAVTNTHVVAVTPGVAYPVSIGLGGIGGIQNGVWNGAPYAGVLSYPNNYGGATWGNPGSNGQSSVFGSVVFPGGQGGKRGEILQRMAAMNEIKYSGINFAGDDPVGSTQYDKTDPALGAFPAPFPNPVLGGQTVQGRTYGIWNPPGIASSQYTLDQVLTIGLLNYSQAPVANSGQPGPTNNWLPGSGGAGGGGAGGASNNIYSIGGGGGYAAFGAAGNNFSYAGGAGYYGGGGGGGGGGEGVNYNNTHDGSPGGDGGAGFIEISWMQ
jgi:hypothetical protein